MVHEYHFLSYPGTGFSRQCEDILVKVNDAVYGRRSVERGTYRYVENINALEAETISVESECVTDALKVSHLEAILNICQTIFVCFVLGIAALMFSRDANELVLIPIERMVKKVRCL